MDLGNIPRRTDVVGSDGEHLGTVDRNRTKLRRDDSAAGGQRHRLAQDAIASVDGDTARLSMPASQARQPWRSEARSPDGG